MSCVSPSVALWFRPEFLSWKGYRGYNTPIFRGKFRGWSVDYAEDCNVPVDVLEKMQVYLMPCGKCRSCRLDNLRQWCFRGVSELASHENSCFITLTVDDAHMQEVFPMRNLRHEPFQHFMKKLRKEVKVPLRYMMCGEYGTHSLRPHYHIILFGWFPPDYQLLYSDGYSVYTSAFLDSLWRKSKYSDSFGFHTVAEANPATVSYLTGYVMKKLDCSYPGLVQPYLRCSTRPAIGLDWYKKYRDELFLHGSDLTFPNSYVLYERFRQSLPRYFVKRYALDADNVDYVGFLSYRQKCLKDAPSVDKCDLDRERDYLECVTKASHNSRVHEV